MSFSSRGDDPRQSIGWFAAPRSEGAAGHLPLWRRIVVRGQLRALVYELLEKGRRPEAVAFSQLYSAFDPQFRKRLLNMGNSFLKYGMKTQALDLFEKAAALDPDDAEAVERVKSLRGTVVTP